MTFQPTRLELRAFARFERVRSSGQFTDMRDPRARNLAHLNLARITHIIEHYAAYKVASDALNAADVAAFAQRFAEGQEAVRRAQNLKPHTPEQLAAFARYEGVLRSGRADAASPLVRQLAGLSLEEHIYILNNAPSLSRAAEHAEAAKKRSATPESVKNSTTQSTSTPMTKPYDPYAEPPPEARHIQVGKERYAYTLSPSGELHRVYWWMRKPQSWGRSWGYNVLQRVRATAALGDPRVGRPQWEWPAGDRPEDTDPPPPEARLVHIGRTAYRATATPDGQRLTGVWRWRPEQGWCAVKGVSRFNRAELLRQLNGGRSDEVGGVRRIGPQPS